MKTSFENFNDDIKAVKESDNLWKGNLSDRWSIGKTPNGGYSMAFAAKAISNSLTHKDPLAISANYLERVDFGETYIKVVPVHITKSLSTARAELIQDKKIKVIFTATFTDFSKSNGLDLSVRKAPDFEPYENCILQPYKEGFNPLLEKNLDGETLGSYLDKSNFSKFAFHNSFRLFIFCFYDTARVRINDTISRF